MADNNTTNVTDSPIMLGAEIGTEMQVEIPGIDNRLKLLLIGLSSNQYLIFHLQKHVSREVGDRVFTAGVGVNIRGISRGAAFGFHSSILAFIQEPDILLFIKYPEKIQQHTIRKNQRVKCLLPARLVQGEYFITGTVADISRSGCNFQAKKETLTADQVKLAQPDENITFALSLPGMAGEKNLTAIVKNTFIDAEKAQIGIQFTNVNDAILKVIDNFIAMSFDISPF